MYCSIASHANEGLTFYIRFSLLLLLFIKSIKGTMSFFWLYDFPYYHVMRLPRFRFWRADWPTVASDLLRFNFPFLFVPILLEVVKVEWLAKATVLRQRSCAFSNEWLEKLPANGV
jgi:hypothetical protein